MDNINSAMAAINRVNPRYNDEVKSNYSAQKQRIILAHRR